MMIRRSPFHFLLTLVLAGVLAVAVGLAFVATGASSAARTDEPKPTGVLVHGAWADASGWADVIERLQKKGYPVIAPANPLRSLDGDAAYLASVLGQTPGDIILVGHSYGGAVMTNAAEGNPNVKALVYVAAFVPDIGEDVLHLAGEGSLISESIEFKLYPPAGETDVDVYIKLDRFREAFAGDLPKNEVAAMAASQRPVAYVAGAAPTTATAWKTIPSWYMVATQDRTITPDAQRFMASRAGATIVEVNSSHVAMMKHPGKVVDLIEDAIDGTQ